MKVWHCAFPILIGIAGLSFFFDSDYLLNRQIDRQKEIGQPNVNHVIYNYCELYNYKRVILTDYQMLKYLPALEDCVILVDMANDRDFLEKIQNPSVTNILITTSTASVGIQSYINAMLAAGKYNHFIYKEGWNLIETSR